MAYINVAEWSPDQVTDWLKGLDNSMYKYVNSFANNEIKGQTLLNIRPYELNELGITSIGHQEIVLEAVEQLRNFHYDLEKENLQFLALRVATTAKNLHHQLAHYPDKSKVETQILNDITRAIATIKPLVGWLDRSPFKGQLQFNEIRKRILRLGIEMATSAQRDRFVENPVDQIRLTAEKLSKLADYIIQDISDPIILQPATLNLVTLKKRESELEFNIVPNYHGIHVITNIKYNSPAYISGKIEEGDEIIQINYQTVVGWHYKRVLQQLQESPPDVLLTLKKRPRHTKIYGQIYMKPYRLPSKKRVLPYRFGENLPSPRIDFVPPRNFPVLAEKGNLTDSDSSSSSSILIPTEPTKPNEKDLRLYLPKPRAVLQRRNTICGDQASGFRGNITFWHEMTIRRNIEGNSLRDKSVSVGYGLDATKRPITCIGIHNKEKYGDLGGALKGSLPDMMKTTKVDGSSGGSSIVPPPQNNRNENDVSTPDHDSCAVKNKPEVGSMRSKMVKFNPAHDIIENSNDTNVVETSISVHGDGDGSERYDKQELFSDQVNNSFSIPGLPIKQKQMSAGTVATTKTTTKTTNHTGLAEAINVTLIQSKREQQSKESLLNNRDEDKPPEIGPRNEFLKKIAPKPPPRPSKAAELVQRKFDILKQERNIPINESHHSIATPFDLSSDGKNRQPKSPAAHETTAPDILATALSMSNASLTIKTDDCIKSMQTTPKFHSKYNICDATGEETELLTPNRTKTLTLKKKNSILAKRRKICLKTLEFSDIQGHLFRRTKDKHGVTYWAKLYFVLIESALYGFRNKNSQKANCLIFLPGFTISLAKEVHSKPFAYKVYHPRKTFYFAAESEQALSQWMDYIRRATLKGSASHIDPMQIDRIDTRDIFSETDSSEDENEPIQDDTPSSMSFKHSFLGGSKSSKKRGSIDDNTSPSVGQQPKSEKYHLGFGSLKKFTNLHNLPFSSNKGEKERDERKKSQSDIPVPTAQFRSYRKIPGNAGMQLGSNAMQPIDYNLMAAQRIQHAPQTNVPTTPTPVINDSVPSIESGSKFGLPIGSANASSNINFDASVGSTTIASLSPSPAILLPLPTPSLSLSSSSTTTTTPATIATMITSTPLNTPTTTKPGKILNDAGSIAGFTTSTASTTSQQKTFEPHFVSKPISKLSKNKASPFNYMHASNPNLVEFTFQTSKTLDVGLPKVNGSNTFDPHHNLQGFITLKDLMLQREEDEAHNMYNNRVNLGVEKPNDRQAKRKHRRPNDVTFNESNRSIDENENSPAVGATTIAATSMASVTSPSMHGQNITVNKIQRRSLPKTPDYAQSFKTDDTEIIMARSKEGQKLRDFGYEFISGDDMNNSNTNNGHNSSGPLSPNAIGKPAVLAKPSDRFGLPTKRKGLNWIGLNLDSKRNDEEKSIGKGSFKVNKQKCAESMDPNRIKWDPSASTIEVFHVSSALNNRNDSINFPFTNGTDRKTSAPNSTSYLSKLTFHNKNGQKDVFTSTARPAKEKRWLGSPRLHRAASSIFGRKNVESPTIDHQIFAHTETISSKYTPTTNDYGAAAASSLNSMATRVNDTSNSSGGLQSDSANDICAPISFIPTFSPTLINSSEQNIEYPPIFVPETYSLRDPNVTH